MRSCSRCLLVLFVASLSPSAALAQSFDNIADQKALPSGPGLAQAYSADRGIRDDALVLIAEDFEDPNYASRWDEVRNDGGNTLSLVADPAQDSRFGEHVLQVRADLKSNTGGGMTRWFESSERIFVRWYVRFDPECDYVHHFCTLRANKGLQGGDRWSGFGGAGEKPRGDTRFSTALEPWGNWGQFPPPGRWNFYSYWQGMKPSPDGKFWGNSFLPGAPESIPRGEWICCEMMLAHNAPSQEDGEQAFWIDGELRGHWRGIAWRTSPTLWANAFTLESYVTDRWTQHRINTVYFDNVVVAREYIGPTPQPGPIR